MKFEDGSTRISDYNAANDVITYTDENGSVFTNTFDPRGRKTACSISKAAGVIGTDSQSFEFDGLSRASASTDTVSPVGADADFAYDSLGRVCEETQAYQGNTRQVTNDECTSLMPTRFTFPSGRQIESTYDSLYRRTLVEEASSGADIARWEFVGPSRVVECELGNGLICSHMNNARTESAMQPDRTMPGWGGISSDRLGYDGAGRNITKRYLAGGINGGTGAYNDPTAVVGATTELDRSSNKYYERSLQAESRANLYQPRDKTNGLVSALGYDSISRLRQYQRGLLNNDAGGNTGGSEVTAAISLPNTDEQRTYDLDGLGNWKKTAFTPEGGSQATQSRQHNFLNQITKTKNNSTEVDFTYDGAAGASNGNLQNDSVRKYEYDAFDRLVKVYKDPNGTPTLIGTYTYDALGRRIRKVVSNGGLSGNVADGTTDYIYIANRCCEDRNGANNPTNQYVWGRYIDELIQQRINPGELDESDRYMLSDLLSRSTALTDNTGAIVETYDTDVYGNTLIFSAAGTGSDWWADDALQSDTAECEFIFTGRRYDPESENYYYRARYFSPQYGRYISRDPISYGAGMNLYQYVRGNPVRYADALGMRENAFGDADWRFQIWDIDHWDEHLADVAINWNVAGPKRRGNQLYVEPKTVRAYTSYLDTQFLNLGYDAETREVCCNNLPEEVKKKNRTLFKGIDENDFGFVLDVLVHVGTAGQTFTTSFGAEFNVGNELGKGNDKSKSGLTIKWQSVKSTPGGGKSRTYRIAFYCCPNARNGWWCDVLQKQENLSGWVIDDDDGHDADHFGFWNPRADWEIKLKKEGWRPNETVNPSK